MRKILLIISLEIMVFGCLGVIYGICDYEYKRATLRCGTETNLVTNYTSQGDRYYTCKK